MGLQGTNGVLCNVHFNCVLQGWHQGEHDKTRKVNRRTIHLFHYHTARTVCGYRATCNSTWENTFLLINGFLTPRGTDSLTSMIHCCQFVQTSMSLLLMLRQRNFTTDTRCQVVTSFFLIFYNTPLTPPPQQKKPLSYLINNFIFFIKY